LKKCLTILLALLLFINSGGFIIIFYQVQNSVKSKAEAYIRSGNYEKDKVVEFRLNKQELYSNVKGFVWKDNKEFEYKGTLYDIINIETNNHQVIIYCLNDIAESKIMKNFSQDINDLAAGKLNNSKYKTSLVNLISQALFIFPYHLTRSADQQKYLNHTPINILTVILDYPVPPPKSA
jgi:hypothetical protein